MVMVGVGWSVPGAVCQAAVASPVTSFHVVNRTSWLVGHAHRPTVGADRSGDYSENLRLARSPRLYGSPAPSLSYGSGWATLHCRGYLSLLSGVHRSLPVWVRVASSAPPARVSAAPLVAGSRDQGGALAAGARPRLSR
jgi:hypothetical protein